MTNRWTVDAISSLDAARRQLRGAVDGLSNEALQRKGTNAWSVKDILAHVAMWDEMELLEMRRSARGGVSIFDHRFDRSLIDRWNDVQFRLRGPLPLDQVRDDLRAAREDIVRFLGSLAQDSPAFISTACSVQAKHDIDHAAQIRAWRDAEGI